MPHEYEGLKEFKQWILKRNELPLRNNNSDYKMDKTPGYNK